MRQIIKISIYVLSGAVGEVWRRKKSRGEVHHGPVDLNRILQQEREPTFFGVVSRDESVRVREDPLLSDLKGTMQCRNRMLVLGKWHFRDSASADDLQSLQPPKYGRICVNAFASATIVLSHSINSTISQMINSLHQSACHLVNSGGDYIDELRLNHMSCVFQMAHSGA